ncbi:hypothetical protein ACO03V_15850 [Microbacterium sp. HMH0099]|uniref:hypothetical protein n=1 Tax=Microbacterium sp. HMH0099 TaxID=3414026 RepID=UPI003BF695A1
MLTIIDRLEARAVRDLPTEKTPEPPSELLVYSGGYLIRVETSAGRGVGIHAPGVPPSIISDMLWSTGAGHLCDYDEALLVLEWRERLIVGSCDEIGDRPTAITAVVHY